MRKFSERVKEKGRKQGQGHQEEGKERHQNVICDDMTDDREQMRERAQTERTKE